MSFICCCNGTILVNIKMQRENFKSWVYGCGLGDLCFAVKIVLNFHSKYLGDNFLDKTSFLFYVLE